MIIDTAVNCTNKLPALKKAGVTTVIRYLTTNRNSAKLFTPAEARAFKAAGMRAALVFEVWGGSDNFKHADIDEAHGEAHAAFVKGYLPSIGAPADAPVYFAVDTDTTSAQLKKLVGPYFEGLETKLFSAEIGVYGAGATCAYLGPKYRSWLAQSKGWNGYKSYLASNKWTLLQAMPKKVAGIDCDPNTLQDGHDMGDFIPFT